MSWSICVVCFVICLNLRSVVWYRALFLTTLFCCHCAPCLCFSNVLIHCWDIVGKSLKGHNLTLPTFAPIYPKESDSSWTEVLFHCAWVFCACLLSGGIVCKAFVCFLMFLYACAGCAIVFCLKVNWSASQLSQSNLCFAFWKLFWCFSQVLPCFIVLAWIDMLPFVFPYILPCPAAFLVLCICSAS